VTTAVSQVTTELKAAGGSHPGLLRDINEDRFHVDPGRGLFLVIDGVGGQAAGEKAAETALGILRRRLERETGPVDDRVREAIALANAEILRLASIRSEWAGMACVLTVAVVVNGEAVVGHVGDTRLYKLRAGRIEKLTKDHSPVGEREDAGEISEADAMRHPRRNEVYRDVGSEPHGPSDPEFIDLVHTPFEPDAALLLCSDGLSDGLGSAAIRDLVEEHAGRPNEVVRSLILAANDAGGRDNVTVVYVEGPRFTQGEDTRDLRRRAIAPAAAAQPAPTVQAPPVSGSGRRWRTLALVGLLAAAIGLSLYTTRARWWPAPIGPGDLRPAQIVVGAGQSIAEAIGRAGQGTEVVVEPGEYRERLRLKDGVRILSRVPRAASIRVPAGGAESDAAIVALDVANAGVSGFRIVGDAETPLGTGIFVSNSDVVLADLEVTGARQAGIEFAGDSKGSLLASHVHDNAGAGVLVRSPAAPRLAHNVFARGSVTGGIAAPLVVEPGGRPALASNVFPGISDDQLALPPSVDTAAVKRDNWFPDGGDRGRSAAPGRRGGTAARDRSDRPPGAARR
jgi:PPM family protein phosphatase